MSDSKIFRIWPHLLFTAIVIAGLGGAATLAQTPPAADDLAEVRKTLDAARKELATYKAAGGAPGAQDHPAVKWDAALWAYRERYPRSEAATMASAEAVRLLVRSELWDRAQARIDSLEPDDPAWERMPTPIYELSIARKDLRYSIDKLSRLASSTTNAQIKAAALLVLGRAHRRQGDTDAASRSLEAAKAAAPDTSYAKDADGLLYEIKHLSVGLPAPAISAQARNGGAIDLVSFRGKAAVLVFWGTT
jgi:hypothetical protein